MSAMSVVPSARALFMPSSTWRGARKEWWHRHVGVQPGGGLRRHSPCCARRDLSAGPAPPHPSPPIPMHPNPPLRAGWRCGSCTCRKWRRPAPEEGRGGWEKGGTWRASVKGARGWAGGRVGRGEGACMPLVLQGCASMSTLLGYRKFRWRTCTKPTSKAPHGKPFTKPPPPPPPHTHTHPHYKQCEAKTHYRRSASAHCTKRPRTFRNRLSVH